ncbi:MAG: DUF881 domain-containing protein, partial [Dermatophilaceae bacterium]|nr:DUF881 domain-containing protein [Dermatophilaceae bacterium]
MTDAERPEAPEPHEAAPPVEPAVSEPAVSPARRRITWSVLVPVVTAAAGLMF